MKSFIEKNISDPLKHFSRHNVFSFDKIQTLRALDKLPEEQLKHLAQQEAMSLIRHAATHSAFYKNLYRGKNWKLPFNEVYDSLPVISKKDIRLQEKKIATRPLQFMKKSMTSGTTGAALAVYRSPVAILNEYAYVWYYRMAHGLRKGDPIVSMRKPLKPNQLFYFNKAENILYLSPFDLSTTNIDKFIDLLTVFKPKALLAYPSFACNLVHLFSKKNFSINIPLIFTSSETLHKHQRYQIEEFFKGRIFDWYGNVERTIAIGECEYGNYHEMPLYSYNEFGETGILTTSLVNKAYPIIKYFVDDRIVRLNESCTCGKQHIIRSIDGRISDYLLLNNETYLSGPTIGSAFMDVPNIMLAQIVQKSPQDLDVNVVVHELYSLENENLLLNNLKTKLPEGIRVTLNKVDEDRMVRLKSGKFNFIVSEFSRQDRGY